MIFIVEKKKSEVQKIKLRIKWWKVFFHSIKPSNYYFSRCAREIKYLGFYLVKKASLYHHLINSYYFLNSTFLYAKCPLAWAQILLSITLSEKTVKKSKFSREKKTFFHAVLLFFTLFYFFSWLWLLEYLDWILLKHDRSL